MLPGCRDSSAAFVIRDLLGLLVVAVVAASLALAAARQMRQEAQAASSISQLRWLAGATASYAADSNDQFWSFSWKAGPTPSAFPDLQVASGDIQAAAMQATDILRRLTGRTDLPLPAEWFAHPLSNHLPLADYFGSALPDFNLIAPGDEHRLNWARDPEAFDRGAFLPFQPDPSGAAKRWPYTSSYVAPAAWWNPDNSVYQGGSQHFWIVPAGEYGGVVMSDVAYPAQKVMAHDQEQREFGAGGLYCVDGAARAAMLMADGSAGVRPSDRANWGWDPARPTSPTSTRLRYSPSPWEAQGGAATIMIGRYRWTRGGIAGRDFGGPEVDTGQ